VRADLGVEIPMRDLVAGASLRGLAKMVAQRWADPVPAAAVAKGETAEPLDSGMTPERAAELLVDIEAMSPEQMAAVTRILEQTES
ncbi:MAG TPA: hypothetical protein VGQ33_01935, partial [Vicinamibacteria bacterium]|nr:hypothetical protein [Vicinamibacteria bacterium]